MSCHFLKCPIAGVVLVVSTAGCNYRGLGQSPFDNGNDGNRGQLRGFTPPAPTSGSGGASGAKAPRTGATTGSSSTDNVACSDPTLGVTGGVHFVTFTGTVTNECVAGNTEPCSGGFRSPSDVAIDYGMFPFDRRTRRDYFYAVVAQGYEQAAFADGATGNLSDTTPSSVDGDRGSGDSVANRTLVVGVPPIIGFFPSSPGTHEFSFPPSQFMTIHLAPFDTTPSNKYVAVICPTNATSRCDCAFDAFEIVPRAPSGGSDAGGEKPDAGSARGGGMIHDAGVDSGDSGQPM